MTFTKNRKKAGLKKILSSPVQVFDCLTSIIFKASVLCFAFFLSEINAQNYQFTPISSSTSSVISTVQTQYPPIAKIVGEGELEKSGDEERQPVFYGSGVYVAEVGDLGIVLTNWHVVEEAKGNVLVRFASFESAGVTILADTVWDIAAIVIHKPPFLPFPISLEVPQIGDELWVAGYGQRSDLNGFQLSSGPVLRYNIPEKTGRLPCESISIGTGIRYGDSGGPILNQYGELAGIVWGTDGFMAMGTFCLRLQAFLTQAQFQLMNRRVNAETFFAQAQKKEIKLKKIAMPSIPARDALKSSGVYPVSSRPIYRPSQGPLKPLRALPDFYKPAIKTDVDLPQTASHSKEDQETRQKYINAHRNGYALPPYPAVESPTFIAQSRVINRSHPEVYDSSYHFVASTTSDSSLETQKVSKNTSNVSEVRITGATTAMNSPSPQKENLTSETAVHSPSSRSQDFHNVSQSVMTAAQSDESNENAVSSPETTEEMQNQAEEKKDSTSWLKRKVPGFPDITLGSIQSIIVTIILLFLFINSLRLLSIAAERPKKKAD